MMTDAQKPIPSFYSGFLKLFSGLAVVQLLNFAFSIILPRYYSPEDYALFGIFTSVAFILLEIIALKLDMTIFFPKEDMEALEIVHVVFLIAILVTAVLLIAVIPFCFRYDAIYMLLPALMLIYGLSQPLNAWFTRKQQYNIVNNNRIIVAVVTPLLSLLFIIYFHWNFGLIIGFLLGQLSGMFYLFFSFDEVRVGQMNFSLMKKYMLRYSQFPAFGVLSSLINSFTRNSIVLFVERFFGTLNAGYYTMSSRILNTPAGMYQASLSQVYIQQAAQLDQEKLKTYTKKILWFGFALGIVPVLLGFFFGPKLFGFLFGTNWTEAGRITQYSIWWFFSMAIINPVGMLVDIKQKLGFELGWNIGNLVLRMGAIAIGVYLKDFYAMLTIITVVGVGMNLFLMWYVLKLTDEPRD